MEAGERLGRLLSKERKANDLEDQLAISCRQFFTQKVEFHTARGPDSHLEHLKSRYTPLNKAYRPPPAMDGQLERENAGSSSRKSEESRSSKSDGVPEPKVVLYKDDQLVMGWKEARAVGSGLCNLGNTCFLNSVLQCLTYTPPLYNYVASGHHNNTCNTQAFCAMCEFNRHCKRVFGSTNGQVKPIPIVKNLRAIAKHFHQGRQEDAHEFLRYFIDSLQKCCLHSVQQKLDVYSKATTVIHQIFGGYHRSQVKCLNCSKMSNTFDPLLDISVDIKTSSSLTKALQHYIKPDLLEGDNSYACPFCKKMTRAQKRLTVHRLPNVLTIQLKRFDYNSMFGGKVNKQVVFPEHLNMRPFMSSKEGPSEWYKLYGVLVHFGFSCHSGHYYCYIRNSNNVWFCMNDSQVTQVGFSTVLQQEAYLLFYIRDKDYKPHNISIPPGSPALNPSTHFKSDPNFLGSSVKRGSTLAATATGLDKTGTPLVRPAAVKPTGIVQPSPKKDTTVPQGQSASPSATSGISPKSKSVSPTHSNGSSASGGSPPVVREFSIPLRKISSATPTKSVPEKMDVAKQQTGPHPQQLQTTPTPAITSLRFTPRQITAPSAKSKKVTKPSAGATLSLEGGRSVGEGKSNVSAASHQSITAATPIGSQSVSGKSDSGKDGDGVEHAEAKPSFKAIQSHDGFIGPTLPPSSAGSPSLLQSPLGITPFSLKAQPSVTPKVALVPPQPQARGKPVARVRPNPHLQEGKEGEQSVTTTKDSAQSSGPHMNAVTPWKVKDVPSKDELGATLPEGLEYNSSAHGWNVSTLSGGEEGHHGKSKKHKKKKKHKRHAEDKEKGNESEGEREGKKDRSKKESKRSKVRDVSRSPERGRGHHSPERNHHSYHSPEKKTHYHDGSGRSPHHDKYRKHRRYRSHRERELLAQSSRRHKHRSSHHSHRDRSRSFSRSKSRSRSPLDPKERHHHRHRTPPPKHAHPESDGEGYRKSSSGHHSEHGHHRGRHTYGSDSSDKRVNDEIRQRERKRSHQHDGASEDEHEHKKHKKSSTVVMWDSPAGHMTSKWDGAHHSSTVDQLTSHAHRSLGENVKSWDGGDNIIDSSRLEGEGQQRGERESWDAEMDRGKTKKVKSRNGGCSGEQFSSEKNLFQDFQNKRNISSGL